MLQKITTGSTSIKVNKMRDIRGGLAVKGPEIGAELMPELCCRPIALSLTRMVQHRAPSCPFGDVFVGPF